MCQEYNENDMNMEFITHPLLIPKITKLSILHIGQYINKELHV